MPAPVAGRAPAWDRHACARATRSNGRFSAGPAAVRSRRLWDPVAVRRRPLVFLLVPVAAVLGACSSAPTSRGQQAAPTASTPASTAGPTEPPPTATPGWLTYDHDPQRSGYDPTSPPPSGATAIRPAWTSAALDGAVYAQPLVTSQAVVVATENDTVYSLSPSTGAVQWERHLATPVQGSALPCGDIDPSGITGTPVIDPTTRLVWVVTFSGPPMKHTLWALRLADGAVAASKPADPPDSNPAIEQQRGALALTGACTATAATTTALWSASPPPPAHARPDRGR
jgi:hypothetical protein